MSRKIRDSVVVITGASSGIGRATALECARKGGSVVVSGRRETALKVLAQECEREGGRAVAIAADVNDPQAMNLLARTAIEHFGRIDVWFNNAAVTVAGYFDEVPPEVYRQVIETNLFGTINGTRAVLPWFREQGSGILINHSSVIGKFGAAMFSAYSTSKFAIRGFSEALRQELRGSGIDVCLILPSAIDTPIYNQAANYSGFEIKPVEPVYSAERVARTAVSLMERPRPEVIVGNAGRAGSIFRAIAPYWLSDRVVGRQWETDHFKPSPAEPSSGNVFDPDPEHAKISGGWPQRDPGPGSYLAAVALTVIPAAYFWRRRRRGDDPGMLSRSNGSNSESKLGALTTLAGRIPGASQVSRLR